MRTCFAVLCALALLGLPFLFAYFDAERLLEWPDTTYQWFDAWLPLVMIVAAALMAITLPWILDIFGEPCNREEE
jgi:hypothetical protein